MFCRNLINCCVAHGKVNSYFFLPTNFVSKTVEHRMIDSSSTNHYFYFGFFFFCFLLPFKINGNGIWYIKATINLKMITCYSAISVLRTFFFCFRSMFTIATLDTNPSPFRRWSSLFPKPNWKRILGWRF